MAASGHAIRRRRAAPGFPALPAFLPPFDGVVADESGGARNPAFDPLRIECGASGSTAG